VSAPRRGPWWVALVVMVSAALALLAHAALVDRLPAEVGAAVSLVPVALVVAWLARRARHPAATVLAFVALGAVAVLGWNKIERHFPDLFFVEHAGGNLLLAIVFGRTLVGKGDALVTRFARLMHEQLPPEVERYTRRVTLAWTILFTTLFALSCGLYFAGLPAAWSVLANIVNPIAIVGMFGIEYAVRLRALPNWEQVGILGGVRAFSRHFRNARFEAPR
jgi:uncharacterized membrane protein